MQNEVTTCECKRRSPRVKSKEVTTCEVKRRSPRLNLERLSQCHMTACSPVNLTRGSSLDLKELQLLWVIADFMNEVEHIIPNFLARNLAMARLCQSVIPSVS